MAIRVGVIGTGKIGQDHIRRLTRDLSGAVITAVADIDTGKAEAIAHSIGVRAEASAHVIAADACPEAQKSGGIVPIAPTPRPSLHEPGAASGPPVSS